ncbi:MAG: four helix bundle protein [Candidatus Omnitrophota bacterium]|nr:MAG: four helix bundle protein [Candidatus Omnitrophota bacterium]
MRTFRDLKVWQKGIDLVKEIYSISNSFPKEEQFGLTNQMRRAAVSIPANIAEGFRRAHAKEHKQFLNIALGSCAELETHVIIARELGYIEEEIHNYLLEILDHICAMTVNLSKRI